MLTIDLPPKDVVEATLAELSRRRDWAPWLDAPPRTSYLAEVSAACAAWDPSELDLVAARSGPQIVVLPAGVRSAS